MDEKQLTDFGAFIGIVSRVGLELDTIEKIGNALHDECQIKPEQAHKVACIIWNSYQKSQNDG